MPIDFSTLKFSVSQPILEENEYDEYPYMKKYTFTVDDPNPTAGVKYATQPEPLVTILVKTLDRTMIPPGDFYLCMDAVSDDFLQFSTAVFNKHGNIKPSLYQPPSPERGSGVWGPEINHGILAYIDEIRVSSKYQRQGVGHWAIENLLNSNILAHCPYFFIWATPLNTRGSPFAGPLDFESKKQGVISFLRSVGFRRVAGTFFFGYARNQNHPMRSLNAENDAGESHSKGFNDADTLASFLSVIGS